MLGNSLLGDMKNYEIENQTESIKKIQRTMKTLGYEEIFANMKMRTFDNFEYYQLWKHEESSFAVLTFISPLGEILIYKLDQIRLGDL